MKKKSIIILSLLIIVGVFSACNKVATTQQPTQKAEIKESMKPEEFILGKWKAEGVPVSGIEVTVSMDFKSDGKVFITASAFFQSQDFEGTYKIDEKNLTLSVTGMDLGTKSYEIVDGNIIIEISGKKITLVRE